MKLLTAVSRLLVGVLTVAALAAPLPVRAAPAVAVDNAWARPSPQGTMSAAYFTLTNAGDQDDTLLGAESDVAAVAEVHNTEMQGGVMRMRPAGPLPVPAGGTVTFQPGGLHVMLIDLKGDLAEGQQFAVTLQFERSGAVSVPVTVRQSGG